MSGNLIWSKLGQRYGVTTFGFEIFIAEKGARSLPEKKGRRPPPFPPSLLPTSSSRQPFKPASTAELHRLSPGLAGLPTIVQAD